MKQEINPVILTAKELNVRFGEQVILNNASLSIHEGDRIGLVGRNGTGKSTFLKIISEIMEADSGEISKKKDLEVGFLSQEFTLDETKSVYENVLSGAKSTLALIEEYESLPYDSNKKLELEEKIISLGGWNLESSIKKILKTIHAPDAQSEIATLSGGEKRRVALCRALISQPELLILDEPTNHLDTESIEWIEKYLAKYKGTCIFVTHDRYFLDRIATKIVELTSGEFILHNGNYTDYLLNKSERQAIKEAEEKKRQNFLRRELQWVVRGPKARGTKAKHRLNKFHEVASQSNLEVELDVELVIPQSEKLGNRILELNNISFSYGEEKLINNLNFLFTNNRRLGIVGNNGVGKSTLLKLILEELAPTSGEVVKGEKTNINYIDQGRLTLNDEDTVVDAISDKNNFVKFGDHQLTVWSYLKRFLFTDDRINTLVGRLSGGEKSRLTLAKILKNGGNFLMLDEPTNDLDLPTLRILEEALINFKGCVVVVSHDRYFLNRVCNGILSFEGNGNVYFSEGNYNYYLEKRAQREKESLKNNNDNVAEKIQTKKKPQKKLTYHEKKELETIEGDIMLAEEEVERIETIFSSSDFYEKYASKTNELNVELKSAKAKVKKLYDRWEELEEKKNSN